MVTESNLKPTSAFQISKLEKPINLTIVFFPNQYFTFWVACERVN